jgi:hemolysin activation/secretion protein
MHRARIFALVAMLAGSLLAGQAVAVDAGAQLRRFQDETQRRIRESRPPAPALPELPPGPSRDAAAASTAQTHVAGFEVHGVTQFSAAEISEAT